MTYYWLFRWKLAGAHVHVEIRCGRQPSDRALIANVVMEKEEWEEFLSIIEAGAQSYYRAQVEIKEADDG